MALRTPAGLIGEPGPPAQEVPATGVDVWRAELDLPGWPSPDGLPAAERERALRLERPGSLRRWSASRWALRAVLGRYLGGAAALPEEFETGRYGKPALPGAPPPLRFNLSHSADLALVAVAAAIEVGVDVERVDPRRDVAALAPHALDEEAAAAVLATAPAARLDAFHRAWVRREAIVKCGGEGLGGGAPTRQVAVMPLEVGADYAAALAVPGTQPATPRLFAIEPVGA